MSAIRRMMMVKGGGEDYSSWVKVVFHLNSNSNSQYIVDGNTSRVPDAALNASRIIIDGTEITPTRTVAMTAGDHTVLYNIGDGGGYGWWYWVSNIKTMEFPSNITNLASNSIICAASGSVIMTFFGAAPFSSITTATYVRNRQIYVREDYKQGYIDLGFTNITTF